MTTSNQIVLPYTPRPYFIPFHARKERFAVLVCHRRAGKTEACLAELISQALNNPFEDSQYAYMAPFMGQAKKVAWKRLKKLIGPQLLRHCKLSETTSTITLPNNATIHIIGAENYDALRGMGWDGIVLDEAGDMHPDVWGEVILPALMDRIGWAVFIGTPKGHNFFYKQHQKAQANDNGHWFSQVLKASENKWLPQSELELIKHELDEDDWAQELECSFDKSLKHSFWGDKIDAMVAEGRTAPFKHNRLAPVHMAFDIGISDDTACWFYQVINGGIDVIDHFSESGLSMGEVVDLVKERCDQRGYKMGDWWLPHDAGSREWQTGKTAIEELYARGFNVRRVPAESVYSGIQAVRHTLPYMRIHGENCADGLQALKSYQKAFNEKTQSYSRTPLHDWSSHSADAMRYLCLSVSTWDLKKSTTALPARAAPAVPGMRVETPLHTPSVNTREPQGDDDAWMRELLSLSSETYRYERI